MRKLFLAAAIGAGTIAGPAGAQLDTPLIPRDVLFGNPERAAVQISPDGSRISFLAPVDGVLNVWVGPADDPAKAVPVTKDTDRGIRQYFWAYTNDHIIYLQDRGGDENWRAYSVNLDTGDEIDLTPFDGVQARVQQVSSQTPRQMLLAVNNRNPQLHDVYLVDVTTGDRELVQENPGFAGFVTDDDYNVRLAVALTPDGGQSIFRKDDAGQFVPFDEIPMADALNTGPAGFDKSGKVLYMTESRGRNTSALVAVDLASGKRTVIAENDKADLSDVMAHPTDMTIEAVAFTYDRKTWQIIDDAIADDFAYLRTVADGDFEVLARTLDDSRWIVAYLMDDGPVRYYRYDRAESASGDMGPGNATFLFTNRPALEDLPLAKMHPVVVESRDGLDLVCYLTVPVGADARPARPLPMVLLVHGGPWARDDWGYSPMHQWLANRGYAVLSVNYRGSTGFGKDFVNAANMEWAGKMHDDLIDAVDWAVREKIADEKRVAIMGGSYGGYATLVGLTFTPEKFAAGVDIVGPSNLVTLLDSIPDYWKPVKSMFTSRVGDDSTEEGRELLESRSPLNFVERIDKPLLIGQGANDPRVKQAEADQIVEAMKSNDIPVTYVLFPDEGHGFARPENRTAFNAVTEVFLAEHLGGRYEPIGDDLDGSTIQVPEGAGQVPGLSGALESKK